MRPAGRTVTYSRRCSAGEVGEKQARALSFLFRLEVAPRPRHRHRPNSSIAQAAVQAKCRSSQPARLGTCTHDDLPLLFSEQPLGSIQRCQAFIIVWFAPDPTGTAGFPVEWWRVNELLKTASDISLPSTPFMFQAFLTQDSSCQITQVPSMAMATVHFHGAMSVTE